jgi:polysaccharide biosynthesis transport protein
MSASQMLSPSQAMAVLRRRYMLILLVIGTIVGLTLAASLARDKTHAAEATLLFRDTEFGRQLFGAAVLPTDSREQAAATNLRLVSLGVVAERTAADLDLPMSASAVEEAVTVRPDGSDLIDVEATADDPETAALIANAFAESYVEFRREVDRTRIAETRELVEEDLEFLSPSELESSAGVSLQRQVSRLRALEALQTANAEVVQPAEADSTEVSPRVERNVALAAVFGVLLGMIAVFVAERLDRRIREVDRFGKAVGLPVLATVPELDNLGERPFGAPNGDGQAAVHSFLMLRSQLRDFDVDTEVGAIVVSSAAPEDGRTTVARQLAASGALSGESTILVEADLHRPSLAERLSLAPSPGLSEYLSGQNVLETAIQHHEWSIEGPGGEGKVDVITAGALPPNPGELLESERMEKLIATLRRDYRTVIIDTPPILGFADAIPVLQLVDGILIVAQIDRTTDLQLQRLAEQLRDLKAPALGVVVNHVRPRRGSAYDGYGYGYPQAPGAPSKKLQIPGSQDRVKIRSPWAAALLPFVTLGIYHLVWWYRVNRELRDYGRAKGYDLGQSPTKSLLALFPGALIIVPALVTYWRGTRRIQGAARIAGKEPLNGWIALMLYLLLGVGFWAYLQVALNGLWRAGAKSLPGQPVSPGPDQMSPRPDGEPERPDSAEQKTPTDEPSA